MEVDENLWCIILSFLRYEDAELEKVASVDKFLSACVERFCRQRLEALCQRYSFFQMQEVSSNELLHTLTYPRIVLIGGVEDSRRCDVFFPNARKKWKRYPGVSLKRDQKFDVIYHHHRILVVSGESHVAAGTVEVSSAFNPDWGSAAGIPAKLVGLACISLGAMMCIIGGYNQATSMRSNDVYVYDEEASALGSWNPLPARLISARAFHSAAVYRGRIWVAGGIVTGQTLAGSVSNSVEIYNPPVGEWEAGPSMVRKRYEFKLLATEHGLWAVGGDMIGVASVRGTIERLHEDTYTWEKVTDFPRRRTRCASVACGSKIFVFGGSDGGVTMCTWDAYDMESNQWESDRFRSTLIQGLQKDIKDIPQEFGYTDPMISSTASLLAWSAAISPQSSLPPDGLSTTAINSLNSTNFKSKESSPQVQSAAKLAQPPAELDDDIIMQQVVNYFSIPGRKAGMTSAIAVAAYSASSSW